MNRTIAVQMLGVSTLAASPPGAAQAAAWQFDPAALVADSQALLLRAPDREIDQLFQAVHAAAQVPDEAAALCGLFDPEAEHGLDAVYTASARLGDASRERLTLALAAVVVAAVQHPPQPYDPSVARQALKAAGATAAILHDGFLAGLDGDDRDARCRSVGQLLGGLRSRPLAERAAATRLLLREGLARLGQSH